MSDSREASFVFIAFTRFCPIMEREVDDMQDYTAKALLPACSLNEATLGQLWDSFGPSDTFTWSAEIGTGSDRLGKVSDRPAQTIENRQQMVALLQQQPYIDYIVLSVEAAETGNIAIVFRNYPPAGGSYAVTGKTESWVQEKAVAIQAVFTARQDKKITRIYGKWIFGAIQTAIPLTVASIAVIAAAVLLIPATLRHSDYLWWITAGTVVLTLRLAYSISDRLILYIVKKFPYIRWQ